jgi:predicted nucleotidyltransferase
MNVTEERINLWAQPISETEETKCQNAISQVTDVIRERFGNDVRIILQGSHKNRTNVRAESDVDIAVVHNSYYFPDISALSEEDKKLHNQYSTDAEYKFSQFKADIHDLLIKKFGTSSVERKNKCIRIHGNTYRVHADVVPAYKYKRYRAFYDVEAEGIAFLMDSPSERVKSFPEQHYKNGVSKNDATSRAYKAVVRILKNVRNELVDKGLYPADTMPSFFIECLVWNVPHHHFGNQTHREDARSVALQIWSDMRDPEKSKNYAEVCDLHWLFRGQTKRTPAQAEAFMLKAWSYLEK